jgi:hypothetical protein
MARLMYARSPVPSDASMSRPISSSEQRDRFNVRFVQVRVLSYFSDGNAASHPNGAV